MSYTLFEFLFNAVVFLAGTGVVIYILTILIELLGTKWQRQNKTLLGLVIVVACLGVVFLFFVPVKNTDNLYVPYKESQTP